MLRDKTVEIQIMQKFMTSETLANMQCSLPAQYSNLSLPNYKAQLESKERNADISPFLQLICASCGPLLSKESVWTDLTSVCFESLYKLASFDQSE